MKVIRESIMSEKFVSFIREYHVVVMFFFLVVICIIFTKGKWVNLENILNIISRSSIIGIISIAQCVVLLTGRIDLSVGSILAVFCAFFSVNVHTYGILTAIIIAFTAVLLFGIINGVTVAKTTIPAFVATLATMIIARSLQWYITGAAALWAPQIKDAIYGYVGAIPKGAMLFPIMIWLAAFGITYFMLNRTKCGRHIYAVGGDERVAIATGISTVRIKMFTYMFSGALCAIGGFLYLYRYGGVSPMVGEWYLLDSIAAPLIGGVNLFGGRGKLWKAMLGVLVLTILVNFMNLIGIDPFIFPAVKGGIIVVAVIASIWLGPPYLRTRFR